MSGIQSRNIPVALVFVCGLIVTVAFFIDVPILSSISDSLQTWAVIVSGFALGLGIVNMLAIHSQHISRKTSGQWPFSVVFILFFLAQAAPGLVDIKTLGNPIYVWVYTNIFSPLAAAMYAILGFFIVSAAYRAMRARSLEAAFVLIAGIIVMLKNAPIGAVIWSGFPALGTWILDVPSAAGNRAVFIGAGIGTILLGLRVLLGYERGYLGGR